MAQTTTTRFFTIEAGLTPADTPAQPWLNSNVLSLPPVPHANNEAEQVAERLLTEAVLKRVNPNDRTPIPLNLYEPENVDFPDEALCGVLKDAVNAIVDKIQCPPALAAMSVLSAAALAAQGHVDFLHPMTGQIKPVSLFLLTIAESGERKTSVDNEALQAAKEWKKRLAAYYDKDFPRYQMLLDIYESECDRIKRNKNETPQTKIQRITELGLRPVPPLTPIITCEEPTIEGLYRLFLNGQPSLGLYSSEGGQFIGGHGMNDEARRRTAAALNSLWDGESVKRVRSSGEQTFVLNNKRLSIHLMVQPNAAREFLSKTDLQDLGIFARFLVAFPNSTIGTRFQHDKVFLDEALYPYHGKLFSIFNKPLPMQQGKCNELCPRVLSFTADAVELFKAYSDFVEGQQACGHMYENIRGFASKTLENAARIAGVMTAVDNIDAAMITADCLESAINILGYFLKQTLALFEANTIAPDITDER